ncbi:MAG: hypothetical protein ABI867_23950 [Kofleriaceae bacterium]
MKRTVVLVLLVLATVAGTADARRARTMGGERYVANGSFGLGLELGSPSGLNGKYFLNDNRALNFGLGWIYDNYYYNDRNGIHLYLDYMFHPFSITNNPTFQLPFYIGVGGRLWDFDDRRDGRRDDGYAFGVRCPIGIAFDFNKVPLDVFVQLTFVADVLFAYEDDRTGLHIEGSFGVRYWFD